MSLQVCHCGWSKNTTYHGLRTHQGKMGCTPKGVRVKESEQYMWDDVGLANNQKNYGLDAYIHISTEDYSDLSLQVCHCGWSKVTTYHGLRTHQGKMGCTPKGMRIPRDEQWNWNNDWEEVDQMKHKPTKEVKVKKEVSESREMTRNWTINSQRHSTAITTTIKDEPKSHLAIPQRPSQIASKSGRRQLDFSTGVQVNRLVREHPTVPRRETVVRPKEKERRDQTPSQVKEVLRMCSAATTQETAVRPKTKHREEQKLLQVKHFVQKFSEAATAQVTAVQPKEKDRADPRPQNIPDSTSVTTQINFASAEATTEDHEIDFSPGMKVKELLQMFSATQERVVQPRGKQREGPKRSQVKRLGQKPSATAAQDENPNLTQPFQGSPEAERLEIYDVFSEVVRVAEDAKRKSVNLSLSTLRTTTSNMMEQIHLILENLTAIELKWISKFAVDVELDPTTAYRCLVSAYGKKVSNGGWNQEALGGFGSVLGLNKLTSGKSYWEVVVSNNTGWTLGVAKGDANSGGKLSLKPDDGYWVIEHYENKYAALKATPVPLSLKVKPQKVGVFVDFEEGLVSFYDVTTQSHIYSFTGCWFAGEIYPYFSLRHKGNGETDDPLIISTVKHQ